MRTSHGARLNKFMLPVMALLAGVLGGLFGIGGGMLISPLLLQIGIAPEVCNVLDLCSCQRQAIGFSS